jgi:hypothetical protein
MEKGKNKNPTVDFKVYGTFHGQGAAPFRGGGHQTA